VTTAPQPSVTDWLEIVVPVSQSSAEDVAAELAWRVDAASAGTEIRSAEIIFWVPVSAGEEVLAATRQAARDLVAAGYDLEPARVEARPAMPESEWRDAWKKYFHVTRLTRQIVIVPSWETYPDPAADDLIIDLDPGQAFGTGAHATTRLVLESLQALRDSGARVTRFLDVGAGSGILSIAALRLWPEATGLAVDNDPIAVDAARDNAAHNGLGDRLSSSGAPLGEVPAETFELVLANIQADVLRLLRDDIMGRVAPGGTLVLSGLLTHQAQPVASEYAAASSLTVAEVHPDPTGSGWARATLVQPDPT
jgi:ribosomal protein L11 methyltransferase